MSLMGAWGAGTLKCGNGAFCHNFIIVLISPDTSGPQLAWTKPQYFQHEIWSNLGIFPSKFTLLEIKSLVSGLSLLQKLPVQRLLSLWRPKSSSTLWNLKMASNSRAKGNAGGGDETPGNRQPKTTPSHRGTRYKEKFQMLREKYDQVNADHVMEGYRK
ncbi:hypothetical protein SERLADRAFT_417033 [Serpula lacrymans var. lacrymans S7.9]|uniref:Uncharacterized protein n=1 Tax=Serpula lacrymans var. lacrymans (strain S7.9) TaxID=578457 RepID=F8P3D3_SERL9|nr:uncharacterized protein SERLADRAFT_417033 [Serpula lacrymans var. lacrymans S7.9]EGO22664.1 hypothetical protein SERLADRAFT_417033 [Serpula lacrymans var. lacrymans S7.9]